MKKNNFLFLILFFLLFQSCSKSNDNTNPTSTMKFSWSCKVNGVAYSWSGNSGADGVGGAVCQYNPMTEAFSLGMTNAAVGIVMLIPEYKKATYVLDGLIGQSKKTATLQFKNPGGQVYNSSASNKITLVVGEALNDKISGTFSGSLAGIAPVSTGTVTITEGKFTLQKY